MDGRKDKEVLTSVPYIAYDRIWYIGLNKQQVGREKSFGSQGYFRNCHLTATITQQALSLRLESQVVEKEWIIKRV